jgi:hypothetical protein
MAMPVPDWRASQRREQQGRRSLRYFRNAWQAGEETSVAGQQQNVTLTARAVYGRPVYLNQTTRRPHRVSPSATLRIPTQSKPSAAVPITAARPVAFELLMPKNGIDTTTAVTATIGSALANPIIQALFPS